MAASLLWTMRGNTTDGGGPECTQSSENCNSSFRQTEIGWRRNRRNEDIYNLMEDTNRNSLVEKMQATLNSFDFEGSMLDTT